MIQVCSQCGTRWNVRDKQRSWCPRCGGTLLAPAATQVPQWAPPSGQPQPSASGPAARQPAASAVRPAPKLAPGYRWIAVRPGAAPPARRVQRPLGPTPRYRVIPRWGLDQYFGPVEPIKPESVGPKASTVRALLMLTTIALGFAVFAHVFRYVLLLINRTTLLHPVLAYGAMTLGVVSSVLVLLSLFVTLVFLANWLIARRAAAYRHRGQDDPRSQWEILLLSLWPVISLVMAPVYLIELSIVEGRARALRRPIVLWWVTWVLSAILAAWSIITTVLVSTFWPSPQGIADNTVITTVGYLFVLIAIVLTTRLYNSFEITEPHRSAHRWIVVPGEENVADPRKQGESALPVEAGDENPAA